jgi:hypothetical protein
MSRWRLVVVSGVMLCAAARPDDAAPPDAVEMLVTTTADAGNGSLRDAILRANAQRGRRTIRFDSRRGP